MLTATSVDPRLVNFDRPLEEVRGEAAYPVVLASVRAEGIAYPVLVNSETLRVIDGAHRVAAALELNLAQVPAIYLTPVQAEAWWVATRLNREAGETGAATMTALTEALAQAGQLTGIGTGEQQPFTSLERRPKMEPDVYEVSILGGYDLGLFENVELPDGSGWAFGIGWARTGSTVINSLLSLHEDCHLTSDAFVVQALARVLTCDMFSLRVPEGLHYTRGMSGMDAPTLRALCETWREQVAPGKQVVGDKGFGYWLHRDFYRKLFPGCQFIFTVRHPLDQFCSYAQGMPWLQNDGAADRPEVVRNYLDQYADAVTATQAETDVITVRFEDLAELEPRTLAVQEVLRKLLGVTVPRGDVRALCTGFDAPVGAVGRHERDLPADFRAEIGEDFLEQVVARCGY